MSDAVLIAIIGGAFSALNIWLSRWMSHREHKGSQKKLDSIISEGNGRYHEQHEPR